MHFENSKNVKKFNLKQIKSNCIKSYLVVSEVKNKKNQLTIYIEVVCIQCIELEIENYIAINLVRKYITKGVGEPLSTIADFNLIS